MEIRVIKGDMRPPALIEVGMNIFNAFRWKRGLYLDSLHHIFTEDIETFINYLWVIKTERSIYLPDVNRIIGESFKNWRSILWYPCFEEKSEEEWRNMQVTDQRKNKTPSHQLTAFHVDWINSAPLPPLCVSCDCIFYMLHWHEKASRRVMYLAHWRASEETRGINMSVY